MSEIWKDIPGYEGYYQVSDLGQVRSLDRIKPNRRGKNLSLSINGHGYKIVQLFKGGVGTVMAVHRVVLRSFVGDPPPMTEACHNDGQKENCRLENLRWDIRSNNHKDKILHGTDFRGEKNPSSKLTANQVLSIREDRRTHKLISIDYGIHPKYVSCLKSMQTWTHLV